MLYNTKLNHNETRENDLISKKNPDSLLSFDLLTRKLKLTHGNVKSKRVLIASCFYSKSAIERCLNSLQGRKVSIVVSALGKSPEKIQSLIEDLKQIERKRNKKIYISTTFPLLHSKIYYAENERIDGANCLVGSANLSENGFTVNEEILVDVENTKTKKQIRDYLEKLIDESIDIDKKNNVQLNNNTDFISFISAGYIIFRPNNQLQLSYSGNTLRDIAKKLKSDVVNGNRNSELSINLETYINNYLNFKIDTNIKDGARIKDHCIETCFGFWLPAGKHHDKLLNGVSHKELDKLENQIQRIIDGLKKIDVDSKSFVEFLDEFYSSIKNDDRPVAISDNQKKDISKDIKIFVTRKIKYLDNHKKSIARGFLVTPMPYFWDDSCAAKEFYDSFWENEESRKHRGVAREIWNYFEDYTKKSWATLKSKTNATWE